MKKGKKTERGVDKERKSVATEGGEEERKQKRNNFYFIVYWWRRSDSERSIYHPRDMLRCQWNTRFEMKKKLK